MSKFINNIINRYNSSISGIIQVGANDGGEIPLFVDNNINKVVMFEPQYDVYYKLLDNIDEYPNKEFVAVNMALGDQDGWVHMYRASNNYRSTSILPPKLHLELWDNITFGEYGNSNYKETTLDIWMSKYPEYKDCNMLFMDTQGYELKVLQGAVESVPQFDYILTEVSTKELFEGGVLLDELDTSLRDRGFERIETDIWEGKFHGNALYTRCETQ